MFSSLPLRFSLHSSLCFLHILLSSLHSFCSLFTLSLLLQVHGQKNSASCSVGSSRTQPSPPLWRRGFLQKCGHNYLHTCHCNAQSFSPSYWLRNRLHGE
eukprot:c31060_g1_i1 orf=1-297(-)